MNKRTENIEEFILNLLHVNDVDNNKLVDIYSGDLSKTFILSHHAKQNLSKYVLEIICSRIGKIGNTILTKSSLAKGSEQILGKEINDLEWKDADGHSDPSALHKFIANVYKDIDLKGNNSLFLSVGAITWKVPYKDNLVKKVVSPLILFPIKLIRSASLTTPIYIEFVNDDIYINPCFLASLSQIAGEKVVEDFPHPNADSNDVYLPIDINKIGDGQTYFEKVLFYVNSQRREDLSEDTVFDFDKDVVAISQYNHSELCMYYDIKRNKEKIYNHPLINRIFSKGSPYEESDYSKIVPQFIMQRDSVQERITKKVLSGQSLIVKGPPGTGKTATITNLIASLLAQNKKVLLSSQKAAALCEVYAKLPESIRKFVMLLDSETESQASKLNVVDVKKEFNQLLQDKKNFVCSTEGYKDFEIGNNQVATAISTFKNYNDLMFENKDVVGIDYYTALDTICNYNIQPVLFADGADVCALSTNEYAHLSGLVEDAGEWFDKVSNGHVFIKSPWYPANACLDGVDTEKAVVKNKELSLCIKDLLSKSVKAFEFLPNDYKKITLLALESIFSNLISEKNLEYALNLNLDKSIQEVCLAYQVFVNEKRPNVNLPYPSKEAIANYLDKVKASRIDGAMKKSEFLFFNENFKVFEHLKDKTKILELKSAMNSISEIDQKIAQTNDEFYSIFSSDISAEDKQFISASYEILKGYEGAKNLSKPKVLDFKAKKVYAKLKNLGYGRELAFAQVVQGVCLNNQVEQLNLAKENVKINLFTRFKAKISEKELLALFDFVNMCEQLGYDVRKYVIDLNDCKQTIFDAINECCIDDDFELSDLLKVYIKANAFYSLKESVESFLALVEQPLNDIDIEKLAKSLVIAKDIVSCNVLGSSASEIYANCIKVNERGSEIKAIVHKVSKLLTEFGQCCFKTYYTIKGDKCMLADLEVFEKEGQDRNIINAVSQYLKVINSTGETYSLQRFFKPFEIGIRQKEGYTFKQIFELSVLSLAVQYKQKLMGQTRNGLGDKIRHEIEDWKNGISQIDKANLSIIESQCMAKINCDDVDFAFLKSEKTSGESLRRFFKEHAKSILKLKKCFILSPSTASVFFTKEEFSDFDTVIIDEASQIEPTYILPVLFRSKQVVLVGDEWQMPPIRHFVSRAEKKFIDEDGEIKILSPNTSVLGLALENCAFPVEQLACHYRSKTESLIAFSQDRFYPNMRTFPARVPKTEGLGFKDVYVPEGRCDGGVNKAEAIAVVEQVREHFDRYYDAEKKSLNGHSIGVVAFGKEQKEFIEHMTFKDSELGQKIQEAIDNFDDLAEKLIFFKTIETVQGQEAEHLILSLTYGKNKNGQIVQSFGELNRGFNQDKLGQCIFNVAVTRAKSSVTVVHSVLAQEIQLESVSFIGDYLSIVNKFSQDGKGQWVGKSVDQASGFIRQVADFIISNGVDKNRIIIDYGVNKNSVKIPIVILSDDMSKAELGLWCEKPLPNSSNYLDYNVRYVESLIDRDWIIHRIYIHDWVDNNQAEKENLKKILKKYVK